MPTLAEMSADKQAQANAEQRADTEKYLWERDNYMSKHDREEAERIALYNTHKAYDSLGTYYSLYPNDRGARAFYKKLQRQNENKNENEDEYER